MPNKKSFRVWLLAATVVLVLLLTVKYVIRNQVQPNNKPTPGVPYSYPDEVAVRILVLTYDRPQSLEKCLKSLQSLLLDGQSGAVEIWIDRSKSGKVHAETLAVAARFRWLHGPTTVRVWPRHVGIYGQWIDTWRPKEGTEEVALILEDDVDLSRFAVRWLLAASQAYKNHPNIASVTVDQDNVQVSKGLRRGKSLTRPNSTVFLYGIVGSWGTAPTASHWRKFQDWYHTTIQATPTYHPYTTGADLQTGWYKTFERRRTTDSMWTMWFIHYCHLQGLYNMHPNLGRDGRSHSRAKRSHSLAKNRREQGMHFSGTHRISVDTKGYLFQEWRPEFVDFPPLPPIVEFDGGIRASGKMNNNSVVP